MLTNESNEMNPSDLNLAIWRAESEVDLHL